MADRLLTLEAANAVLAAFFGCAAVAGRPLKLAAALVAEFTVLAAAVVPSSRAGVAATSAKDLAAAGVLVAWAGTFTASEAGGAAVEGAELGRGWRRRCCLASFHCLVLSTFLLLGVRGTARVFSRQEKSTHTFPLLVKVSKEAQTPCSTHSSNKERRREGVGPAAVEELLLGVGGWPVSCWFGKPPLVALLSPPIVLLGAGLVRSWSTTTYCK
jgi:hypothetical protein